MITNPYNPESAEGKAWERINSPGFEDESNWITVFDPTVDEIDPNFEEKLQRWLKKKGLKRLEK